MKRKRKEKRGPIDELWDSQKGIRDMIDREMKERFPDWVAPWNKKYRPEH